jgi:NAD(P)-dependent dehydrogenase (short-subunit alcohol dehydrogenase family)
MTLLRQDLLVGRTVAVGGDVSQAVADLVARLGASVQALDGAGPVEAIVYGAGTAFADGGAPGLAAALEQTWDAIAEVAGGSMIPEGAGGSMIPEGAGGSMIPEGAGGKIVLISPRAGAGRHAEAARAGLENLARTLSIEWARFGITATTIAPGKSTREHDVALLVTFVLSHAGDYFSGCRFELGAVG